MSSTHPPPLRLQHSPSLPNFWLPRHSSPQPPSLMNPSRDSLHTPTLAENNILSDRTLPSSRAGPIPVSQSKSLQDSSSTQSAASPTDATTTHQRKHTQTHLLLTPPLTPSSSIQTTASTDTDATSTNEPEEGNDHVEPQSRFLIVNNVPRTADADTVKNAFLSLLSPVPSFPPPSSDRLHPSPPSSKQTHPKDDPIKGIFVRFQATHGVVILAFFDTRHAAKVVKLMTSAVAARLFIAMRGTVEEGVETSLQCRFLSVDELCKLIGKSSFVEEMNGHFFISIEDRECSYLESGGSTGVGSEDGNMPISRSTGARKLEAAKLRSVLESFGDLLSLNSLESGDQDQLFEVSFHDVRDAGSAFAALDKQNIFGVRLRLFRHTDENVQEPVEREARSSHRSSQSLGSSSTTNCVPFPTIGPVVPCHKGDEKSARVDESSFPPGESSPVEDASGKIRPRSVSAGHNDVSPVSPASSSVLQTPTDINFVNGHTRNKSSAYGFSPFSPGVTQQIHDVHGRRHSNQLFFDAVGKTNVYAREQKEKDDGKSVGLEGVDLDTAAAGGGGDVGEFGGDSEEGWMGLDDPSLYTRNAPHQIAPFPTQSSYCFPPPTPSLPFAQDMSIVGRNPTPLQSFASVPCYNPSPNPSLVPASYYAPPPATSPALHFPMPPTSPTPVIGYVPGYEYDPHFQASVAGMGTMGMGVGMGQNWTFEHAMMVAGANANSAAMALHGASGVSPGIGHPSLRPGHDYWYQNALSGQGIGGPMAYYHPHQLSLPTHTHLQYPSRPDVKPHHEGRVLGAPDPFLHTEPSYVGYAETQTTPATPTTASYAGPLHVSQTYAPPECEPHPDRSTSQSTPSRDMHAGYGTVYTANENSPRAAGLGNRNGSGGTNNIPPERNQLNLARIEDGQDTRTTVMIKNIPNKMSDKDLIAYIGKVCPRRIDFLYLRMDFQNGCNVGYAFVNFIHVQDLLTFAKARLGVKWNMFSSEKVLQMSYANYQGKEALVEKFKNSCIMDEREAWRPKIFHSEPGANQGFPEPFPAPTHLRRKERSSHNRGTLFFPGPGQSTPNASGNHHHHRHHPHGLNGTNGTLGGGFQVQSYRRHYLSAPPPASASSAYDDTAGEQQDVGES